MAREGGMQRVRAELRKARLLLLAVGTCSDTCHSACLRHARPRAPPTRYTILSACFPSHTADTARHHQRFTASPHSPT